MRTPATGLGVRQAERGQALPMVLGALMVFAIAVATVMTLTLSNEQNTRRTTKRERAFWLAEAGVNDAISRLFTMSDPSDPGALPTTTSNQNGGTSTYSGSLSGTTWTVTGVGTVRGSSANAGDVTRTVTQQVTISVVGTPWEWAIFVDQPSGCLTLQNNSTISTTMYVRGNMCLNNGAHYTAPNLYVGGTVTQASNSSIGFAATPITKATIVGGCTGGSPNPHPCTQTDKVYANTIDQTPSTLTRPTVDLDQAYTNAKPGPLQACTVGALPGGFDNDTTRNRSRATFDLTPATSYDFRYVDPYGTTTGQLTWDATARTLTVAGVLYLDGDITSSTNATYTGRATIYASGKITFPNGRLLCGISGCTSSWDTSTNLLLLVAGSTTDANGFLAANNSSIQAAVYANKAAYIDNNATQWGPVIAESIYIDQNASQSLPLTRLPPGAPGIAEVIRAIPGTWRG
jgi:Tfp pilus assembly protein PilX